MSMPTARAPPPTTSTRRRPCGRCSARAGLVPVSSSKPIVSYALGAAGALELAITVMALKHQVVPPQINCRSPDPKCALNLPLDGGAGARIFGGAVHLFAFGGINASLVVDPRGRSPGLRRPAPFRSRPAPGRPADWRTSRLALAGSAQAAGGRAVSPAAGSRSLPARFPAVLGQQPGARPADVAVRGDIGCSVGTPSAEASSTGMPNLLGKRRAEHPRRAEHQRRQGRLDSPTRNGSATRPADRGRSGIVNPCN